MARAFKWAGSILAILLLIVLLAAAWVHWVLGGGSCAHHILRDVMSPDGDYRAVIFERVCGATADASTHISVLSSAAEALPNQPGNTLTFAGRNVPVSVVWISGQQVSIAGPQSKATYRVKNIGNKIVLSAGP